MANTNLGAINKERIWHSEGKDIQRELQIDDVSNTTAV